MNWVLLESIFYLITFSFGLFTIGLLMFSIRSNKFVNTYLILSLVLGLSRAFLSGTHTLGIQTALEDIPPQFKGIVLMTFVFFYLYFKTLASDDRRFDPRNLLHLIVPIFFLVYYLAIFNMGLYGERSVLVVNFCLVSVFVAVYVYLTFRIVAHQIWKNPQKVHQQHHLTIRNWAIFLFVLFLIGSVRILVVIVISFSKGEMLSQIPVGILSVFLQLILYIKLLVSPEILLGIPSLYKRITPSSNSKAETTKVEKKNFPHWKLDVDEVTGPLDERLKEKINDSIEELIDDVETLINEKHFFRNHHITIKELSNELEVPYTHIIYLFKYHCKLTFTEYKTIKRIEDAKHLIDLGFLKHNTLESLATEVGYASYNPFFTSFKKIVGMSPNDFASK